ncbi:hypothetical protein [Clostridioides sp. ZZV15-6597]|uniref:hypothetical protein n=1 Tax=Clostridioides sp. ZZV15-6597 TaxID=2811500 RepID=UPI001D10DFC5|nr:hypothetical protein [Clostridioides sp. ZZV15-6597]HBF1820687.1 hypothetical protein [Clostridioides difficile]
MSKITNLQAIKKFDEILRTWNGLPDHVYTIEYKRAFITWLEKYKNRTLHNYHIVEIFNNEKNFEAAPFWS